jgi:hypothetical protein
MEVLGMNIHKEDLDNNLEYEYNKPVMIPSTINEFSIYMKDGAKVVFSEAYHNSLYRYSLNFKKTKSFEAKRKMRRNKKL